MATLRKSKPRCPPAPPQEVWHGYHTNKSLRNVYIAVAAALTTTTAFYFFNNRKRIQAYRDFYDNYDADKSFKRMQEAGVLSSCPPEPPEDDKKKKNKK